MACQWQHQGVPLVETILQPRMCMQAELRELVGCGGSSSLSGSGSMVHDTWAHVARPNDLVVQTLCVPASHSRTARNVTQKSGHVMCHHRGPCWKPFQVITRQHACHCSQLPTAQAQRASKRCAYGCCCCRCCCAYL